MARGTNWQLSLTDRMSGPARAMTAAVTKLAGGMDRMAAASDRAAARAAAAAKRISDAVDSLASAKRGPQRASRAMDLLGRSVREIQRNTVAQGAASGGTFEHMAAGLSSVAAGAVAAAGAISILGRATAAGVTATVSMITEQESSMVTLETMLGSRRAAREEYRRAVQLAQATPFATGDVLSMRQRLVTSGFRDNRERDVMTAFLSDVAAANGGNMESANRALLGISQMRAMGTMGMEDFGQVREAAGLNQRNVFLSIARARGLHGTDDAMVRQVTRLVSQRQVTADQSLRAILEAFSQQTGGNTLGTLTERQSRTIGGRLSTARDSLSSLMSEEVLTEIPGVQRFSEALDNFNQTMSETSPLAQRLRESLSTLIDRGFTALFGSLSGADGRDRFQAFLRTAVNGINVLSAGVERAGAIVNGFFAGFGERIGPLSQMLGRLNEKNDPREIERLGESWRSFGEQIGVVTSIVSFAGNVLYSWEAVLRDWELIPVRLASSAFSTLYETIAGLVNGNLSLYDAGVNLVNGFGQGIRDAFGAVYETVSSSFQSVIDTASAVLRINSPSLVFRDLGMSTGEGFALGIEGSTGDAQSAMNDLVAPPGAVPGRTGASGGGNTFSVQIIVQGADSPEETSRKTLDAFVGFFEGLAPENA